MPTALLMRPSSPSPASVTPRCRGKSIFSRRMASTNRRTLCTITTVFEALIEITTSSKCTLAQTRRNSMQLSTMPAGVSP